MEPESLRLSIDASAVPNQPGGAGIYVVELVRALSAEPDVAIDLWTRWPDRDRWPEIAPRAVVHSKAPHIRPLRLAWEQLRLPTLLGRTSAMVHHGPHYTMPLRAKIPTVVTIHDLTFFDYPESHLPIKAAFFQRSIRVSVGKADALVAVSDRTAERIQSRFRPNGQVHVIPHGVDHARFRPNRPEVGGGSGSGDQAALDRLGVRSPYIAFVGTLEPRKDVPTLIRAFSAIASRYRDLSLVLAGAPGWSIETVDSAISASDQRDRVIRLGYIDENDKPALLRGATAVAYPSIEEGFGMPALEAMACGTPVVTTSGSAMQEVTGECALLVPTGDVDRLAQALEAVTEGGADIERRRREGLEAASRYTWQASAAAHLAVYRSVVS